MYSTDLQLASIDLASVPRKRRTIQARYSDEHDSLCDPKLILTKEQQTWASKCFRKSIRLFLVLGIPHLHDPIPSEHIIHIIPQVFSLAT